MPGSESGLGVNVAGGRATRESHSRNQFFHFHDSHLQRRLIKPEGGETTSRKATPSPFVRGTLWRVYLKPAEAIAGASIGNPLLLWGSFAFLAPVRSEVNRCLSHPIHSGTV